MKRHLGWLLAFLLGLGLGWGGRTLRERSDPWQELVQLRSSQARRAEAAYRQQPTRAHLVQLIRSRLYERDALSVARYPAGDDPHRYEPEPELVRLLTELDVRSETPAERAEWELLYTHGYNPPPRQ